MSFDESSHDEGDNIQVVFEVLSLESSVEPPIEEWSSLILIEATRKSKKRIAYEQELYDPGSGELCTKYIPLSDSSVFRHPYYHYPCVHDPGIKAALLAPEDKVVYPEDGRELYLATCKVMDQCPVGIFHRSLLNDTVNLSYYCVSPDGIRPMAMALQYNKFVRVLNLTDNFLSEDACFHLGDMLTKNCTLKELNLSGCRIGPEGAKRLFAGLAANRSLELLNLHRNQLEDAGGLHFAALVDKGIDLQAITLSYNNLSPKTAAALADAIEFNNKFTHIDLSWNNFYSPIGVCNFLNRLEENRVLRVLNMSWTSLSGPRIGASLAKVLNAPNLNHLDLGNNKLAGEAITSIVENLGKAKKLDTLNLSHNPMGPLEALAVIQKMRLRSVKIQNLLMDNVPVNTQFLNVLGQVKNMKSKANAVITHGNVVGIFKATGPDTRDLVLSRVDFVAQKAKKNKVDIALVIMQFVKNNLVIMDSKSFIAALEGVGAKLDEDLINEMVNVFPGPATKKAKTVNLKNMLEYIQRKWPERKLPSTPPPQPEPEPEPEPEPVPVKKGKGKGKK